ncbi:MAG: HDOD domain-containing protein [Gammaproteobacteria bacterium]|nr:HDOD domain-containing protein [Gammaproteobacteria bacterium]
MTPMTVEGLIARCHAITSLPLIYQRLDEAINDPYSDLSRIAAILSEDSALSARLLRLANSAMFSFPSRVETVSRAITIVGTKQLRDLVLATSVIELFRDIPQEVVSMESFWRHSIATGICARVIATCRREANVERFYVLGLLHDIGRLIIYLQLPEAFGRAIGLAAEKRLPLYQAERELFGFDHAAVGQELMRKWKLPAALQEGVGCHHAPQLAARYPEDAATVHIADIVANAFRMGSSGGSTVPPFVEQAWERLGLTVDQLPLIAEQLALHYRVAVDIFMEH